MNKKVKTRDSDGSMMPKRGAGQTRISVKHQVTIPISAFWMPASGRVMH